MFQKKHAEHMCRRFRQMLEQTGDGLKEEHYEELVLVIESGLDGALIESTEKIAHQLEAMAHQLKNSAEN